MPHDQPPGPLQEEWRRTDIRRFRLEKFPLAGSAREQTVQPTELQAETARLQPLLTAGVDLAGHASAVDSRPCQSRLDRRSGCAGRALRQPGRAGPAARRADRAVLVHPRRRPAVRQVLRVARGLLVGRDDALRAQGRGDRPAAAHVFGPVGRAERFRSCPDRPGRRRRGHGAGRDRQQRSDGRRLALRRGGDPRRPGRSVALRELAELGQRRLALRPSEGPGRPRRLAAMDHRRLGQPPGQSQSARGPGRRRGPCPGERRDVHRRHAAPLLSYAPAPRGAALHQRPALQGRACRASRGSSGGA